MRDLRCENCHRLLGRYLECEKLEIKCPRCGAINIVASPPESVNCPRLKKTKQSHNEALADVFSEDRCTTTVLPV